MGFQTRDACRISIDKLYIHKLEHTEIHEPVQCDIVIVSVI